ncbi:MAG: YceH family protein [Lysobacterales bacterium]
MQELNELQARVLGCLIEKKETTPEQYPLTANSLRLACNQKTARYPVTNYSEGEVGHAVRELIAIGIVREAWGGRVARYEHDAGKALGLQGKALAVLCPLMLRGPQTLGEIKTNSQRLHSFEDLDDVQYMLRRLAEHEPPLVVCLPRQPGQKEDRYAHLLCGEPTVPAVSQAPHSSPARQGLEQRIEELEATVESLAARLTRLEPPKAGE